MQLGIISHLKTNLIILMIIIINIDKSQREFKKKVAVVPNQKTMMNNIDILSSN
jgi:hypothetical protein